jgi:hypothetical protein
MAKVAKEHPAVAGLMSYAGISGMAGLMTEGASSSCAGQTATPQPQLPQWQGAVVPYSRASAAGPSGATSVAAQASPAPQLPQCQGAVVPYSKASVAGPSCAAMPATSRASAASQAVSGVRLQAQEQVSTAVAKYPNHASEILADMKMQAEQLRLEAQESSDEETRKAGFEKADALEEAVARKSFELEKSESEAAGVGIPMDKVPRQRVSFERHARWDCRRALRSRLRRAFSCAPARRSGRISSRRRRRRRRRGFLSQIRTVPRLPRT